MCWRRWRLCRLCRLDRLVLWGRDGLGGECIPLLCLGCWGVLRPLHCRLHCWLRHALLCRLCLHAKPTLRRRVSALLVLGLRVCMHACGGEVHLQHGHARVVPGGCPSVVIDEVDAVRHGVKPLLPALHTRARAFTGMPCAYSPQHSTAHAPAARARAPAGRTSLASPHNKQHHFTRIFSLEARRKAMLSAEAASWIDCRDVCMSV